MGVRGYTSLVVALALLFAGCSSSKKKSHEPDPRRKAEFEQLARDINPIIVSLRPVMNRVLLGGEHDSDVVQACVSADDSLRMLRAIRWPEDDERARYEMGRRMDIQLALILDKRPAPCNELERTAAQDLDCRSWCIDAWLGLFNSILRLGAESNRAGAFMVLESFSSRRVSWGL